MSGVRVGYGHPKPIIRGATAVRLLPRATHPPSGEDSAVSAISSTLDLLDSGALTFLAPDASSYASIARTHPVCGVRLREIRRQDIADRHTWDKIFPAPAAANLLIRPDGVICWRAQSTHPDPAPVVRTARARTLHPKT
ncbi:hypothetical protein ACFYXQ_39055 [Nocardia jiangxiensis]|uniref:Uncharacterized protein n=1 Tax=Nocardia jiangxiensis TaxID=282685 RepID=A0ABW6SBT7_9NOCA